MDETPDWYKQIESKLECLQQLLSEEDLHSEQTLYHYTNACAALNITKNREFWFSNYLHLEDDKELRLSDEIIKKIINTYPNEDMFQRFEKKYFELRSIYKVFLMSFCDKENNQCLWNEYAENNNGCLIGLTFPTKNDFDINYDIVHLRVIYDNDDKFNTFKKRMTEIFIDLNTQILQGNSGLVWRIFPKIACFMLSNSPRFKSKKFESEHEYRLYLMDKDPFIIGNNIPRQCISNFGGKEKCIAKIKRGVAVEIILKEKCKLKYEIESVATNGNIKVRRI